jgi:apolipoprotein N-acyltransferase
LLILVRRKATPFAIYSSAWIGALAFYSAVLQWLRVADDRMYATWVGLSLYCSLFVPIGIALTRWLDRHSSWPLALTFPAVWTALEFLRAHFLTGFAWYFLGHTQHDFLLLVQITDLTGVYGITFLVAAVNALLFELLFRADRFRVWFAASERVPPITATSLLIQAASFSLLLTASLGYGTWRLGCNDFDKGPRIALIQGNLEQQIRNLATESENNAAAATVAQHYLDLSDQAARQVPKPDLIVWPETSCPEEWVEVSPDLAADQVPPLWHQGRISSEKLAQALAQRWHANALLGVNCSAFCSDEKPRRYNSAILIQPNGKAAGRYDKTHCVPFGEYVPLRDVLPWMNAFAPYDFDYSIHPGEKLSRFALGQHRFGVLICYEDTDPYLARQYVQTRGETPPVDFLLNISNDGWFSGTSEHEEHLAICRFRAIECRRAIGRAVNMGISAVIDGNGRVVALPGPNWRQSKKVAAVLTSNIPIDRRTSLYARWGDWFPWSCWLVLGAGLAWPMLLPAHHWGSRVQ